MTSFTDSEKVEYALKTTLNITMSKFGYAPFNETPAPPRVFPSNVMSKDLITYGEGDVDENGAYVSGHSQSGNIDTSLTTYESVLKYYKIVCPVTNKVSKAQLSNVLGATSSQNILGREILDIDFGYSGGGSGSANSGNFWTQPVNSNFHRLSFFRGHYIDENNSSNKFNHANTHYKGLNLAWNHIADGTDVSAAIDADGNGTDVTKIVPHLKLFLQVQTAFQIGADNKENQCFGHSMMKNMLGLDFKIPVQVNVGEVSSGDTVNASSTSDITGPGIASGNEWYTQSTAGTINFYAVGHSGTKVDNSKDPINYPLNSNAPLVTFLKYTGDHAGVGGLGGGGGGGGSFMPITEDLTVTGDIYYDAGNVGIGTTSPYARFEASCGTFSGSGENSPQAYNTTAYMNVSAAFTRRNTGNNNHFGLFIGNLANSGSSYLQNLSTNYNNYYDILLQPNGGNVGIGTTDPGGYKLKVQGQIYASNSITSTGFITSAGFTLGAGQLVRWGSSNYGASIMGYENSNLRFYVNNDERIRIDSGGKVGIGTTSPRELLNISGSSSSSTDILYPLMINNQAMHAESNIGGGVGIKFHMYHNGNTEYRYSAIVGISEATFSNKTALGFYTNDNVLSAPLERMRIDNEGNVGIGTTSPYAKLQISGTSTNPSTSTQSSTSSQGILRLHGTGGLFMDFGFLLSSPYTGWIQTHNGTTNGTGDDLALQPVSGNVGIGTTTPQTQLTVKGSDNGGISIIRSSDNYHWRIFNSDSNTLTFQGRNSDNNIRSGCDDLLCLYDSGKIGIGTNSPNEKLEINGWIGRSAHGSGGFCGSYNNIGSNSKKTNPIYVIGSSYKPTDTTFSSMYGVGYCHSYESGTGDDSNWPRCGPYDGWGFYVASDGHPRIFMSAADAGPEICMRGQHPTIYFRDTNHRSCAIHVNSSYFYVLNGNATDGTTWSTQANDAWALQIDLDNNNLYIGGEIRGPYGSHQCRFTGAIGVGGSAVYSIWSNIGHIGESHGYEVLARYNSSKNGDWLYLDSNSSAPSGYHAQTADGSNMYFNVSGNYCAYIRYNGGGVMNFTGQHKAIPKDAKLLKCTRKYVGLIVISSGTINSMVENEDTGIFEMKQKMDGIDINEAIPEVVLSTIYKQKTVYGVISDGEDEEYYNNHKRSTGKNMPDGQRPFQKEFPSQNTSDRTIKEFSWGAWGTVIKCEEEDNRLFVNGVGEGGIWVCDEMGLIENGDYITSSNIPGYGCVQDDDVLHNYTVAKATMDCDFTLSWAGEKEKCQIKRGTWCIDKRRRHPDSSSDEESDCDCIEEDHHFGEHYEPECCAMSHKKDKHGMVYYPDAICHDASGCCEFETCCDCSGNPIMEDYYFEDADYKCKEITHNGKTYRIAFIACTYHCG